MSENTDQGQITIGQIFAVLGNALKDSEQGTQMLQLLTQVVQQLMQQGAMFQQALAQAGIIIEAAFEALEEQDPGFDRETFAQLALEEAFAEQQEIADSDDES